MEEIKITLTKEQLAKLNNNEAVIILNLEPVVETIKYPVFKSNINNEIFRFDNNETRTLVFTDEKDLHETTVYPFKDSLMGDKEVPYNHDRGLYHMQPIFAWDKGITIYKGLYFYDAINDCVFFPSSNGKSYTTTDFLNIEPLTNDQLKSMQEMIWEMYSNLIKMQKED